MYETFGAEFPIRFDFLDTMEGGNLSFQVHPLRRLHRRKFGMPYTQDESYYLLDAKPGAVVYLGLKERPDPEAFERELRAAQDGGPPFAVERHVNAWPSRKHDHFSIPAGTIHCSGKDNVVLEISATPYIFTFKLWDWERLGLDGKPAADSPRARPREHPMGPHDRLGREQSHQSSAAARVRRGLREETTGLHPSEFIETRRHWFKEPVEHDTRGALNVLNLVEGNRVIVESPDERIRAAHRALRGDVHRPGGRRALPHPAPRRSNERTARDDQGARARQRGTRVSRRDAETAYWVRGSRWPRRTAPRCERFFRGFSVSERATAIEPATLSLGSTGDTDASYVS